ncbi:MULTISPECIES: hypothetical protein [unclassified Streptomyces]|uniref:hypothetical protein n=1 Tax=unclassified Streptomyces TaxID=2593676 RepID=UPI0035D82346
MDADARQRLRRHGVPARPGVDDRAFPGTSAITSTTSFADSDLRGSLLRFTEQARTANQALVGLLSAIARRKGATTAQIALA